MGWYVLCRPRGSRSGDVRTPPAPSPIAAAGVTDNYSIATVKAALSHSITRPVMKATKRGYAGRVGVGQGASGSLCSCLLLGLVSSKLYIFSITIPIAFKF